MKKRKKRLEKGNGSPLVNTSEKPFAFCLYICFLRVYQNVISILATKVRGAATAIGR